MSDAPPDPSTITRRTLADYDARAVEFARTTRLHDVGENIAALLRYIERPAPCRILDFGCGPGRDLVTFAALGHDVVGLDGSTEMIAIARKTGLPVWQQDFLALDLPAARFDGIFANASLQHVPGAWLPTVLAKLHATLAPRGVLFASIPHGADEEGWNEARYSRYHDIASWRRYLSDAGFVELEHFYRPPGAPREQQRWLASVWRRGDADAPSGEIGPRPAPG